MYTISFSAKIRESTIAYLSIATSEWNDSAAIVIGVVGKLPWQIGLLKRKICCSSKIWLLLFLPFVLRKKFRMSSKSWGLYLVDPFAAADNGRRHGGGLARGAGDGEHLKIKAANFQDFCAIKRPSVGYKI